MCCVLQILGGDIERKIIKWITFILRRDDDSAVDGGANQIGPDVFLNRHDIAYVYGAPI